MDGSKDIRSDCEEQHQPEDSANGSFFKKYTLLTPEHSESVDQPIFKKYVPVRVDSNEYETDQSTLEDTTLYDSSKNNEHFKQPAPQRSSLLLWTSVAVAALVLAGLFVFYGLLRTHQPDQVEADRSSPEQTSVDGTNSLSGGAGLQTPEQSDSPLPFTAEERPENVVAAGARRNGISHPKILLNVMLARAREFEDRGVLTLAEQEYRAAASNFPQDKLSQLGLQRVQNLLLEKQKNEKSTVSRETGLREFRMSDFAAAERNLAAAVEAGRSDTATLYALGMSHLKLGSFTQAQKALEQCMVRDPNYAPALVGLAEVNAAIGKNREALPLLQKALELGGGAEFTPSRIKEMIVRLSPGQSTAAESASPQPAVQRSQPTFYANAVHVHDLLLSSCKGELSILNSVVHFNASTPSHSFHFLLSAVRGAHVKGRELRFNANGSFYRFNLSGRSPQDFLDALGR
jgi:Tfp pilus assembly protein PilF